MKNKKRLNSARKGFVKAMDEYPHTEKELIVICERQLHIRLKIAKLQDRKEKAVQQCKFEEAIKIRDRELKLSDEQMPFINLLNILRRKLNKKPIK